MANVIQSNEERSQVAEQVMQSYGMNRNDAASREAAEVIAAKSLEAREQMRKEESRRYY